MFRFFQALDDFDPHNDPYAPYHIIIVLALAYQSLENVTRESYGKVVLTCEIGEQMHSTEFDDQKYFTLFEDHWDQIKKLTYPLDLRCNLFSKVAKNLRFPEPKLTEHKIRHDRLLQDIFSNLNDYSSLIIESFFKSLTDPAKMTEIFLKYSDQIKVFLYHGEKIYDHNPTVIQDFFRKINLNHSLLYSIGIFSLTKMESLNFKKSRWRDRLTKDHKLLQSFLDNPSYDRLKHSQIILSILRDFIVSEDILNLLLFHKKTYHPALDYFFFKVYLYPIYVNNCLRKINPEFIKSSINGNKERISILREYPHLSKSVDEIDIIEKSNQILQLVYTRELLIKICIGLKNLDLPVLQILEIVAAKYIILGIQEPPYHIQWNIAKLIKHYFGC